ncbi:VWA domain-containing protein [Actinoplanes sp. NPDC026619]|uniref:VWA domain-containing protein n=1 Tax=Actinoplanes sp. NPDC026619 TaxID=3155798 RepID=UPI0034003D55
MLNTLAGLVAELRAVGIPVSPTEHIDAAQALGQVWLGDRAAVRAALAATLVKNPEHARAFAVVFDLYFSLEKTGGSLDKTVGDEELVEVLFRALRDDDRVIQRVIAAELVGRHAQMVPGRPVAGTYYLFKALRPANLEGLLERLGDETAQAQLDGRISALERRLADEDHATRVDDFRAEVESEIRRRLVADRGAEAVARTLRKPLPEDIDFLHASRTEIAVLRDELRPLSRKLAARLARRRRATSTAPLDIRRTVRNSLSTGGTPVTPVFRRPHPARPELMVIADISGSVAAFATFTLQLMYALRTEFSKVRSFVFVDGVAEVTELLERAETIADVAQEINAGSAAVWLDGRSDYGHAFELFAERWGTEVRGRTSVIVLGDARNNYHSSRARSLGAIAARARHLYWLNPEPAAAWNDGDSIIGEYAAHCDGVFECRSLRQLKRFVEELD